MKRVEEKMPQHHCANKRSRKPGSNGNCRECMDRDPRANGCKWIRSAAAETRAPRALQRASHRTVKCSAAETLRPGHRDGSSRPPEVPPNSRDRGCPHARAGAARALQLLRFL